MKFLIMGCGRIGATVAISLWEEGHQVTVLDIDPDNFFRLPSEMRDEQGVTLMGDGTISEDVIRAGIQGADVFVAVDLRDSRNALAAQKAKHIFHVPRVVCRIGDPSRQKMYQELGLVAVSPTDATSQMILSAVHSG